MGGDPRDRHFYPRRSDVCHGRDRHIIVTACQQPYGGRNNTGPPPGNHLTAGIFGAPPMASRPAWAQASSKCAPGAPPTPIPPTTSPLISIGRPPPRIKISSFISRSDCNACIFVINSASSVVGRRRLEAV